MSKVKTANHGRLSVFLFMLFVAILYGFGVYSIMDITTTFSTEINAFLAELAVFMPFIVAGLPELFLFLGIVFIITLILSYIILRIMRHFATPIILFMSFLLPFVFIGLAAVLMVFPQAMFIALILALFGFFMLIIAIWNRQRLRRSGKFVEFSAQLVLDEKALLFAPIILALYTFFAFILMGFSFLEINYMWVQYMGVDAEQLGGIVGLILEYVYLLVYFGIYYIIAAFIVSYAFDWYRKEDPSLKTAREDVRQVLAPILWFGIIRASLEMLARVVGRGTRRSMQQQRRSKDNLGAVVFFLALSLVSQVILGLFRFFTYFTLPAIVIKKKGVRDSIRDSANLVWDSWLDIMVGETGFGIAMFVFNIINLVLWGAVGFALGFFIFSENVIAGIVISFVAVMFSTIPLNIVTYPMGTAFKTFLYAYALDRRGGFSKPSRLPAELKGEFNTLVKQFESKDRKRKMPKPSF